MANLNDLINSKKNIPAENCIIELGNSTVKTCHYQNNQFEVTRLFYKEIFENKYYFSELQQRNIRKIILCQTALNQDSTTFIRLLNSNFKSDEIFILEKKYFKKYIGRSYQNVENLGLDRLLNLYSLKKNAIVISCGTAITIDCVLSVKQKVKPIFVAILPGLQILSYTLNDNIKNLPVVEKKYQANFPAKNSVDSVYNGTHKANTYAIVGLVNELFLKYYNDTNVELIFTGGDGEFLFQKIKSLRKLLIKKGVKFAFDENILFKGVAEFIHNNKKQVIET